MNKKILYVDMDNVIVDFKTGIQRLSQEVLDQHESIHGRNEEGIRNLDEVDGIFALMDPLPGAVEAIHELSAMFDLYVLSTSPWQNPSAWSDKIRWIHNHFGAGKDSPVYKRLILSHHKHLNDGHFLVDDRVANGADKFGLKPGAEHIQFGQAGFEDWDLVVKYLKPKA
jgi:5'(3')-deoxyribonucleotidase